MCNGLPAALCSPDDVIYTRSYGGTQLTTFTQTTPTPQPHHNHTTPTPHFMKKVVVWVWCGVVYTTPTPQPHHTHTTPTPTPTPTPQLFS